VISTFYPIPFDWRFKATLSYTLCSPPPPPDYDEQLRALRACCKDTQKRSFIIRLDPAGQPKERNCVLLTFRCEDCGAVREFVKVTNGESTMSASVAEHSGWQIPQ
jgi:hypothetical protein